METKAQTVTDENENENEIVLSEEQEYASELFTKFLEDFKRGEALRPFFVLEGYAGTGKTFSVNTIIQRTGLRAQFMAYTGKAALVLNKYSGVAATTIHSQIYKLRHVGDEVFKKLYDQRDNSKSKEDAHAIQLEINELLKPKFVLNDEAFEDIDLLVLDECSMVNDEMLQDLVSFGIPIIALGDPGQLPPVVGDGALFKDRADCLLTEIRRQALDSPIIKWATWARNMRTLPVTDQEGWGVDAVSKLPRNMLQSDKVERFMENNDITICWKNTTRRDLNQMWRKFTGFNDLDPVYPVVGETIIFLKNDKALGVFNGMSAIVEEVGKLMDTYLELTVRTETQSEFDKPLKVNVMRVDFEEYHNPEARKALRPWDFKGKQIADFGYAVTCHKSQGSQWPKVLVVEENVLNWNKPGIPEARAQWLYTAITRASEQVTIIAGVF